MTDAVTIPSLWEDSAAASLDAAHLLLYRSNLLGADLRVTNFGGGNTSAKIEMADPLTHEPVKVLWVKGSGGDLGSMKLDGFATLYLDKLESLKGLYRGLDQEDEMVQNLNHCIFGLNPRPPSIDTCLHGYVPRIHVDHVHADPVIAVAASEDAEALTREIYGREMGFLPWQRPGIDLGIKLGRMAEDNPGYVGVVLGSHGLFTWADDAKSCYETTLRIINKAALWLEANRKLPAFGGAGVAGLGHDERRVAALRLMPEIRARVSKLVPKVGHFVDTPEVLEFVNSRTLAELAPLGTSCPDHFLRTKIRPLIVPHDGDANTLDKRITDYRADYKAYYERCRRPDSPAMRDASPVIHLIPGVGLISFADGKAAARIAAEFYVNAINVMRGASGVSRYQGLAEQEAFNIEYWLLEEAKLKRLPQAKSLAGRVALVTGGAGGIGSAIAARLLMEGASVVVADIDRVALDETVAGFTTAFGADNVRGCIMDVTSEGAVIDAVNDAVIAYAGLDIVVCNAGITLAAAVEDTTLELWNTNLSILGTGYFLAAREGYRLMKRQGLGGSIVFIGSKNGLAASPGASAYCTAKAAEIHLARCLALEGAPFGIRANVVNPDAVLRGSKIWQGPWRKQRAAALNIGEDQLEEHYRKRSLLQRSVYPEDIAEAVYFFASDLSSKSTGNFLNVDAGNAVTFSR